MRIRCLLLGLVVGLSAIAASRQVDAKPKPDQPPAELLVSVAIGPGTLRGLQAYVEALEPGAGAQISDAEIRKGLASAIGAQSLDGVDPAGWIHVLISDSQGSKGVALLTRVADARTLSASAGPNRVMLQGAWAVVGPKPLVERVGPYALGTMASRPAPTAASATVYVANVLARYKNEVETIRNQFASIGQMGGGALAAMMESYADGVLSAASDTERVVVTIDATASIASLDVAFQPRPGSRFAKFVAQQRPSDFALLGKLPPSNAMVVFAGHLETGPYRDAMLDLMSAMYGASAAADLRAAMGAVFKATTGEVALAMSMVPGSSLTMTQLFGVTDAAAADKALVRALDLFKTGRTITMAGMTMTTKSSPETTAHDGVTLRRYDTVHDLSKVPPDQRESMERMLKGTDVSARVATFDKLGMIALASDSAAEARKLIDAARGKGPQLRPTGVLGEMIAASRNRKDSLVMVLDLGFMTSILGGSAKGPQPVVTSFGFADRNAHFRMTAPAATVRTLRSAKP